MPDEKDIDESWKNAASSEKETLNTNGETKKEEPQGLVDPLGQEIQAHKEEDVEMPEVNFLGYITSLAFQAVIFLGEVPHPMTEKIEKNLKQAKFLIDTLLLIRDKTKGNLTAQENDTLNAFLYELQMKFVEASQKEEGEAK